MLIGLLGAVRNPLKAGGPAPELSGRIPSHATLRAYPSRVPCFPHTAAERLLQQVGHLDAALTATADGCDALVIDSVGDYGLDAIRAAVSVPVFGAGQWGMGAAAAGGQRFGIVTVWPASMNYILQDLLIQYGHAGRCVGITNVGSEAALDRLAGPDGYLAQVRDGATAIIDQVSAAIGDMARTGADSVLLGCTCMSPLAARVSAGAAVPVINPLGEAVTAAGQGAVLAAGERFRLRPGRRDLVVRMVDAVADEPAEDCPICIVAESMGEEA